MNSLKKLPKFIHQCMTIGEIPTSYKISLTYEEQLMWFCRFLEEQVIPVVNNNSEVVQELKTFVENYFDNLDVQEEINNKLDEMAEDGTLEEIITEYLNVKGMLTFNTVSEMKQATNLINGSKARTLGYSSINDGGGALYYIRKVINTDTANDKDIIALSDENLVAIYVNETPYLNVKQFGSNEDGETDDFSIISYALTYARTNNLILQFNKKSYLISGTLQLDIAKDKIEGNNAKILFTGTTLFTFSNSNLAVPYENCFTIIKDLNIKCTKVDITGTIALDLQNANNHISHINFENLNIDTFDIGINIFTNAYIISFLHCDLLHCNKCVYMATGGTNYGERISFIDSTLYNSGTAIENNNVNGTIFLTNCSIDYNTIVSKTTGNAQIKATNSHFEGRQKFIGNIEIANSEVVLLTISEGNLFETYGGSVIRFNNCSFSGQTQTNNLVSNDLGIIEFINCNHTNFAGYLSQLLNDKSLSLLTNKIKCYCSGQGDNTDYRTCTNTNLTIDGTGQLVYTKTNNATNNSYFQLVFHRNPNKRRYRIEFELNPTMIGTTYVSNIKGIDASWNGKNSNLITNKNLGDLPINLGQLSDFTKYGFSNNGEECLDTDTDIILSFNCTSINAGTITFRNIKFQEW